MGCVCDVGFVGMDGGVGGGGEDECACVREGDGGA